MQSDRGAKSLQLCTCLVDQKIWAIWTQLSSMFTPASLAGAILGAAKKKIQSKSSQINLHHINPLLLPSFKLSISNNFLWFPASLQRIFHFHPNSMYNSLQAWLISASDGLDPADVVASRGGFSFSSRNFNSARLMSTYQPSNEKKKRKSHSSNEFRVPQTNGAKKDENEWRWMLCPWTGFQWNR